MNMPVATALGRLLVALLIGLLIGIDRERAEVRKERQIFAGIRTFPLIAMAGCVPMLLMEDVGPLLLVASFLGVVAITVVAYVRGSAAGDVGATTEVAAVGTFLLGALAGGGQLVVAGAAGVATAVLLATKPRLEAFSRALTPEELSAALELAVITVIVLPLVPNRGFGPWQVLNPRDVWLVVVFVATLSFVGFVAVRAVGEARGLAITGAVGGLVSSTAVTMAMAERSREDAGTARTAAAAAVLASTVMCVRVLVLASAVNIGILPRLAPAIIAMTAAGVAGAWVVARGTSAEPGPKGAKFTNPFSLKAAVAFGLIYSAVLLVVRAATEYLGTGGMYAAAALSSVADVDAVTIAFSRLGPGETAWRAPAAAVSLAAVVNTLVKLGLAAGLGRGAFRGHVAWALGIMAAVGAAAGVAVYLGF